MKRLYILAPLAPLLWLTACNSSPTVSATNASAADVAAQVKAAGMDGQFVSPGHWQTTMTINDMSIPGMPAGFAEKMKAHMGKPKAFETCLTPEEAKKPKEDFFAGGHNKCRYDHFTMGDGRIDAAMRCDMGGASRTMTMMGTYSSDAYHMAVTSQGEAGKAEGVAGMSMKMVMDAKRTGACTGKEAS